MLHWPVSASEMAAHIRSFPWHETPLGPLQTWPAHLRMAVDLTLSSPVATILLWGAERRQIYNDRWREMMEDRHPLALGQRTQDCFPEIEATMAPLHERAKRGEPVVLRDMLLPVRRNGQIEDAWWTVQYVPVRDEAGRADGLLCTVLETTGSVQAERQRAAAMAALQASEERLRALVTAGSLSIYRMSADWRLLYQLDSTTLEPTSGPVANFLDKYILDEDRPLVLATIQRAIATKSLFELEHRMRMADGSIGWILSRAVPLLEEDGSIREWFGAVTNVTARKQAEEAQRVSDQRFRTLASTVPAMIWYNDGKGENQFVNRFCLDYTGKAADEFAGLNWQTSLHPDHAAEYVASYLGAVRARKCWHKRSPLRRHDGAWHWFDNHARPLFDASGAYTGHAGFSIDVDASVRAEQTLRQSEERLQSAVKVGQIGLWDANLRTDETYWSDEHFQLQGYAPGEVTPSFAAWISRVHPDDRSRIETALGEARQQRTELVQEYRQQRPDGVIRWLHSRGRFFYDASGEAVRMVGAMMDVTARREWEERQKVLVAELQHRTRNLMAVIRSISNRTARASADLPDFELRFANRLDALARVQALLSRLNDHDRVSFDELIRSELNAMVGSSDQVVLQGPPGIRLRSSTLQTLALALHELATNAVKYGALGQATGHLAVSWSLQEHAGAQPRLLVDWRESGVVLPPARRRVSLGHGRELIERALPYQLGAHTTYTFEQDGVHCTIALPISDQAPPEGARP